MLTGAQQAHLSLIQGIISRQAGNSFLIKGWVLTVAVAVFGFAIDRSNWQIAALGFGPVIVFGWLDAFFFRQERLFRCLYEAVVSSDARVVPFSMNTTPFQNDSTRWRATIKSLPYAVLYTSILVSGLVIVGVLAYAGKPEPHSCLTNSAMRSSSISSGHSLVRGHISPIASPYRRGTR